MSFQVYLDNIEAKTGKTPNEFVAMAKEKGYDAPETKAGTIIDWLKQDFGLGRGHAMAFWTWARTCHGVGARDQERPGISDKHVGTSGVHRDEPDTLRLCGKDARQ